MSKSESLMQAAVKRIPGGVNSPVRAYKNVGMTPRFIERANGAYIYDVDGKEYIDYICSWGPMILGHNNPEIYEAVITAANKGLSFGAATEMEVKMADFICSNIPWVDMIRMVNSGTEAVMSAVRLARGYTGRSKIIKFAGNYHGHSDSMLVEAGSGLMTAGVPGSAGVVKGCAEDTLTAAYNDISSVTKLFEANKGEVAAVIVEPVAANMGVVLPKEGFLEGLREICTREGAILVFDEVITGFRLAFGGAAEYYGIIPDLVTYGKIIGGGMPVGAYGGKKEIMECVAPVGSVYQAGTLSGNPIAMAAGYAGLSILKKRPQIYEDLRQKGEKLYGGMVGVLKKKGVNYHINSVGSLGCLFFSENKICDYAGAKECDTQAFSKYFAYMINNGIHIAPSQFEAMFISSAHGDRELDMTLTAFENYFE